MENLRGFAFLVLKRGALGTHRRSWSTVSTFRANASSLGGDWVHLVELSELKSDGTDNLLNGDVFKKFCYPSAGPNMVTLHSCESLVSWIYVHDVR